MRLHIFLSRLIVFNENDRFTFFREKKSIFEEKKEANSTVVIYFFSL